MNNGITLNIESKLGSLENTIFGVFKKENAYNTAVKFSLVFIVFTFVLIFAVGLESVFLFSSKIRTLIVSFYAVTFLATITFFLISFLINASAKKFDAVKYSLKLGKFFPAINDKLANAISLCKNDKAKTYTSNELITANFENVYTESQKINFVSFIDYKKLKTNLVLFLSLLVITTIVFAAVPQFSKAFQRLINFNKEYNPNLLLNNSEAEKDSFIKTFTVTIKYPDYTKLPEKTLEENKGDVFCLEGSTLKIKVESVEKLSYAAIMFNGQEYAMNINDNFCEGTFTADKDGDYFIVLKNSDGKENVNRNKYSVRVLKDEAPKISIVQPADANYNIYGEKDLLISAIISDDYGFSKLSLSYRNGTGNSAAGDGYKQIQIPIQNPDATSLEISYVWALENIGRRQGGETEYFMEVTDNAGKSTRSDLRRLIFSSSIDALRKSELATKDIKSDIKTVQEEIKDLQKSINEVKKTQEENAVNEQRKKDLQNKVENIQKNLDAAQNKIDQTMNQLKQNPNLSEKTLEQFMKLQELFQKINTPEFREMLKKLQEAMKKNNEQMKRDLDNIKFDEEAFKKQLEQVMELMKKIENLQKMGELTQKLDEITKSQEELKKETEQTDKSNESKMNTLADKQNQVQEKFNKFKEDMKNLIDNMKNTKNEMSPKELEDLQKKMNEKRTEDKMQKSSKELFKQQKEQSEQTQKEISDDLNEFNEQMQESLENAMSNMDMQSKMKDKLKQIKKNLEELSEKEQDLKDETNKTDKGDKEDFNDLAKEQGDLQQQLSKEINDLMNATKDGMQISPELGKELGNSYNKMDNAGKDLKNNDKTNAMSNQGKAKQSLDNAAKMLGDMIAKMGEQQGKGNKGDGKMGQLMQKLAEIIGQQQGVNGKMNKMGQEGQVGRDGKGGKEELSQIQKEQLDRLRIEQMEVQKSLEQLNEEFEKERQRSGEKLLGDLNEVTKEMQETVRQLSEYDVNNKLFERQNKILSRMLDAQLSQREKDFEQKRESKPGENVSRQSPKEVVISGPRTTNALQEDLLRMEKESFNEDYESLIIEYNKRIKKY